MDLAVKFISRGLFIAHTDHSQGCKSTSTLQFTFNWIISMFLELITEYILFTEIQTVAELKLCWQKITQDRNAYCYLDFVSEDSIM